MMFELRRLAPLALVLALGTGLVGCAPAGNSVVGYNAVGSAGYVSAGTIVGMRPVQVQGSRSGVGAAGGAVAGGLIGSTIGGDWRARTVAGVIGALAGGLAGGAIEEGVTRGNAMEFIIRDDDGQMRSVIQTNEQNLAVGERVIMTQTDRVRLSRAGGGAPAGYGAAYPTGAAYPGGAYGGGPVDMPGK